MGAIRKAFKSGLKYYQKLGIPKDEVPEFKGENNMQWFNISQNTDDEAEILIFDEIGGWGITALDFIEELKELRGVSRLNLRIHSPGGSVFEGLAMFNAIRAFPAEVVATVEGLAASMASVLLMAADRVIMPDNSFIMIHEPWTVAIGDAEELRHSADRLEKLRDTLVNAYHAKTEIPRAKLRDMLADETWMNAEEAKELGFADEIAESMKVAAKLRMEKPFDKIPEAAKLFIKDKSNESGNLDNAANSQGGTNSGKEGENTMSDEEIQAKLDESAATAKIESDAAIAAVKAEGAAQLSVLQKELDPLKASVATITKENDTLKIDLAAEKTRAEALGGGAGYDSDSAGDDDTTSADGEPTSWKEAIDQAMKVSKKTYPDAVAHCARVYPELHAKFIGFSKEEMNKRNEVTR